MGIAFQCDVCKKIYPHPDLMVECLATHFDAFGVCPNCDSSNCAFDLKRLQGKPQYVCKGCRLIINQVMSFDQLYQNYLWVKNYAERCNSYYGRDFNDHVWVQLTGWSRTSKKAKFYHGSGTNQ